jgi:hypothetical protein
MTILHRQGGGSSFIALGAVLGLMAGGLAPLSLAQEPPQPGGNVDQMLARMHDELEMVGKEIGGYTDEEKTKLAAHEKKITDEVKADPKKLENPQFKQSAITGIRDILTPEHQKKFDMMVTAMTQRKVQVLNSSNLHQISLLAIAYNSDHAGKSAPDLGTLVAGAPNSKPQMVLTADSKTAVPDDWKKMDPKARAEWVNKNTDFVYLAGGKTGSVDADFVVAYIKPDATAEGNAFMMGDGRVVAKTAEEAKAVIDELVAGKNPAPSLK